MKTYYDDNFDPRMVNFLLLPQVPTVPNVTKRCMRCDRMVNIPPQYAICDNCAMHAEREREKLLVGLDF
jgi:rRNA maturation endonuclease Nob1